MEGILKKEMAYRKTSALGISTSVYECFRRDPWLGKNERRGNNNQKRFFGKMGKALQALGGSAKAQG